MRAGRDAAITVDSAGTGAWHVGDPPDRRSIAVADAHGMDIRNMRGRQLRVADFDRIDLIPGMDGHNVRTVSGLAPSAPKVHLFMDYTLGRREDVPDPYYEIDPAFEALYQMLEAGCSSLLAKLERAS
ncbi:hypothetical protein LCM4579_16375 [Ensifer sp. LCM 4579]|nr:hypothetical protein LCM4579_16375 [Ensifer sp. LCM 4579]